MLYSQSLKQHTYENTEVPLAAKCLASEQLLLLDQLQVRCVYNNYYDKVSCSANAVYSVFRRILLATLDLIIFTSKRFSFGLFVCVCVCSSKWQTCFCL